MMAVLKGFWSLLVGLSVTIREFFQPDVTLQYPDERWQMHERFRGRVDMWLDPVTQGHKCTLCMLCTKACPNGSLEITSTKIEGNPKKILDKYIYKLSTCTLCELCVEACNFDCIHMNQEYEMATFDRQDLTVVLNEPRRWVKEEGWSS